MSRHPFSITVEYDREVEKMYHALLEGVDNRQIDLLHAVQGLRVAIDTSDNEKYGEYAIRLLIVLSGIMMRTDAKTHTIEQNNEEYRTILGYIAQVSTILANHAKK